MPKPSNTLSGWLILGFGALLLSTAFSKLEGFANSGDIFYRASRAVPYNFTGDAAAVIYALQLVVGFGFTARGVKELLRRDGEE